MGTGQARLQCIIMQTVRVPSKLFPLGRRREEALAVDWRAHVCVCVCVCAFVELGRHENAAADKALPPPGLSAHSPDD